MKSEGQRLQRWQQNLCLVCQTRSARLKFVTRYISVNLDRGWDDYLFLDECLKYIDKQAQNRVICGSTCCIPLHAATATECDKKKTKMNAGY